MNCECVKYERHNSAWFDEHLERVGLDANNMHARKGCLRCGGHGVPCCDGTWIEAVPSNFYFHAENCPQFATLGDTTRTVQVPRAVPDLHVHVCPVCRTEHVGGIEDACKVMCNHCPGSMAHVQFGLINNPLIRAEARQQAAETQQRIYNLKKTHFDADDFPTVVVSNQPEPHICVYCQQPVQAGRCRCV
jgi:hypothetical protein